LGFEKKIVKKKKKKKATLIMAGPTLGRRDRSIPEEREKGVRLNFPWKKGGKGDDKKKGEKA